MKRVLVLAFKDLKLITRDKLGMFFMLVFPIVMALFFGSIMGGFSDAGSRSLTVAVVDLDRSDFSEKFVSALSENDSVAVTAMERDSAIDSVRRGKHVGVIILPPKFGRTAGVFWKESPAIEVGVDPSRKAEAGMLHGLVMQSMGQLVMSRFQNPAALKPLIEESKQQIAADDSIPPTMRPVLATLMNSTLAMFDSLEAVRQSAGSEAGSDDSHLNPAGGGFQFANVRQIDVSRQVEPGSQAAMLQKVRSGWDISFPQAMVWAILACVAGFATLIVREQTLGTQTRLLVAPVSRPQLLAGKAVACFICLVLVLTMMTLIALILGMRPERWDLLVMAIGSIGVCFVGLMLPLSLLGRTEQAVSGAVWGVCTVLAMFGGGMIPVVFMPQFVQKLSNYDPVKWAVYSMEGAIWRGFTFGEMLLPCGILVGVGVAAAALGSWMISRREM
ncbi:MAG: ABC transporter permease [Planctomycetaceae bacterium]